MRPGSILQKLVHSHQESQTPINLGVYYKNTLIALCHALEDFVLQSEQPPLLVAAFQQGKWYQQEAERYHAIAARSRHITILAAAESGFAEHDTTQQANVSLVNLTPADPVAQEWHLIIYSPSYSAMVLCQELSPEDYGAIGQPDTDLERKFYGFWTFEAPLVKETMDLAIAHVATYDPDLAATLQTELDAIAAQSGQTPRDDINEVVLQVVHSLQSQNGAQASPETLTDNLLSNEMQALLRMAQLIDQADPQNPNAAAEVATLAETLGQILELPAWQVKRLRLAALLHRLAPIDSSWTLATPQTKAQQDVLTQQGILPKASVLRVMPQMQAIATVIVHQYEHWDGSGRPDGLAYDDIPLESRILAVAIAFQHQVHRYQAKYPENAIAPAWQDCQSLAGTRYDPKLIDVLGILVMGLQQGMSLDVNQIKIASGIWLLDEHLETSVV